MSKNLSIRLEPDKDKNGNTYYVGKLKFPGTIDCRDGVAFLIFTSDEGYEELQIAEMKYQDKNKKE